MRPRVVVHNAISLDGRIAGFEVDLARFYELASTWQEDATLAGCDTLLANLSGEDEAAPPEPVPGDARPLLAVTDSRGRMRYWNTVRRWPFWRGGLALCSSATPREHINYLERVGVDRITAGEDRVDLGRALKEMRTLHGVKMVRVDAGPSLVGPLLRTGLVDEVSLLVHPVVVGRGRTLFEDAGPLRLTLSSALDAGNGVVWLRYRTQ